MSLPIIAVAGGTSQLGRAIVEALLAEAHFTPIVLSRLSSQTPTWLMDLGVEVRRVDYLSLESCETALKDVHTVTSASHLVLCFANNEGYFNTPLQRWDVVF